jgi:uncharacterized protein YjdB
MKKLRQQTRPWAFAATAAIIALGFIFITTGCNTGGTDNNVAVKSVTLNKEELKLGVGRTEKLTAAVAPKNAGDKKVTWKSSDKTKATVAKDGTVTGVAEGEATITATAKSGKTATCVVTVELVAVTGVRLPKTGFELKAGNTEQLTAEVLPADATNQNVKWRSGDTNIATVGETTGLVTAVAEGVTNIFVTTEDRGMVASCQVTVPGPPVAVSDVTMAPPALTLAVGQTGTLSASLVPANATNKKVTFTSSDQTKASADGDGIVTALAVGTATITVKTEDGDFTAQCAVTVTAAGANVNEVQGKSLNWEDYKTVFNDAGLTFAAFAWGGNSWDSAYNGTYTFNSTEKPVTATDGASVPHAYKYEIAADGSLLGQEIFTNKGTNELRGETYSLPPLVGFGSATEYTFSVTGNNFSFTDSTRGVVTGT